MRRTAGHSLSIGAELAISIGSFVIVIGVIILHAYFFGPIGSSSPASHAGAGFAEIGLMILTVGMFTAGTITRMVYRAGRCDG